VSFERTFTPAVNAFVGFNFAENPIAVSALNEERFDIGDFHCF
jgi:hypothetical protein